MTRHSDTLSWRNETGRLFKLAGPLIVNNLSIAGMQFADAVMAGRLGVETLAAVAIGGSLWFFAFTIGLGLLMAIAPIAARHYGAGDAHLIGRYTRQGIYLGLALAIPVIFAAQYLVGPLLVFIPIDPGFREMTIGYTQAITLGAPGMFVFLALRFTTEGIGVTKPIMYISFFAIVCNVFLNWVLIFGNLGAPELGAVGCGIASAITMWLMAIIMVVYMVSARRYKVIGIFSRRAPPRLKILREIFSLGLPIAVTITAEAGLFNAVSILMGTLGAVITAAHQIAISFASTMFMIPLALSSAITVRVGHELGAGQLKRARYAGGFGIFVCGAFMACSAIFLIVFSDSIVTMYTNNELVKDIAISLLLMAALFQVGDGVQIGAAGALRGYKDTRVPMIINTFSYWVLAFPLAYLAAVTFKLPPNYIWGGFVIGLGVAAILLTWRYNKLSREYA
ncbi:MAG: MATE family efflux transporter [Gammaproteobacteria bacterium]|nr:MAG: MATE family efflux transporter [Gammaproteobacteria bacterium]